MTSASARGLGSVEFVFEDDDVVYLLRDAIEGEGGQVAFAESGHEFSALQCPLCAKSGHRNLAASFFDIHFGLGFDGSTSSWLVGYHSRHLGTTEWGSGLGRPDRQAALAVSQFSANDPAQRLPAPFY
jgi:hypothetical protein